MAAPNTRGTNPGRTIMSDLITQEPGSIEAVDDSKIDNIVAMNVGDLAEALVDLTGPELEQLLAAELKGKERSSAVNAIEREQARREVAGSDPADAAAEGSAPVGDATSYANSPATDVNAFKITSPVLTRDGWVVPAPKAEPQG